MAHNLVPLATESAIPDEGKYVYCIIRLDDPRHFGEIGIGLGGRVYTVHYNGLAAVVSDSPVIVYDPTRENVLAHEFVNETVMREFTVIPLSFGTVFRSQEDVSELLRSTYQAFHDVLEQMQGKIEFGVKVVWDYTSVLANIERENDEIRRLQTEIRRNSESSTYFARTQLNRLVDAAVDEARNRYVTHVHERLKPLCVASRTNKVAGERMVLNAAFLVDRAYEDTFNDAIDTIRGEFDGVLTFNSTGPWPPYNFVNIKLKLEKAN